MALPWGFKIFYGIFTDLWRPFGYRRKLYMILGWMGVLLFTFFLAVASNEIDARAWIGINLVIQAFLMLADVPADGYSVEIGQLERPEERGQVLATGQRIRFCCVILGGLIQALLVNGPTTNAPGCPIEASSCWAWGFTPNQYYGLMTCILFVLVVPIFFLKEIAVADDDHGHVHTLEQHRKDIWDTMQNPTTLYLLIFVTGNNVCSGMLATTQSYVQYTLIQLSNFQSGIASILGGGALVAGIMIFQTFFIHRNWRITQYLSNALVASLSLIWIAVYFNSGGTMNAWFTIVLQCTMSLSGGLAQVLFAMAVIELAKKNQEATTYEFIISVVRVC
jgi:MFS family permease